MTFQASDHSAPPPAMYASIQSVSQRPPRSRFDAFEPDSLLLRQRVDRYVSRALDAARPQGLVHDLVSAPEPRDGEAFLYAHRAPVVALEPTAIAQVASRLGWRGANWTNAHRAEVIAMLRGAGDAAVRPVLDAVAECPRSDVEDAALAVLRHVLRETAGFAQVLNAACSHTSPEARATAVSALGHARDGDAPRAVAAIEGALRDPDAVVRSAAAWALVNIDASASVRRLEDVIAQERDDVVRDEMVSALDALKG